MGADVAHLQGYEHSFLTQVKTHTPVSFCKKSKETAIFPLSRLVPVTIANSLDHSDSR